MGLPETPLAESAQALGRKLYRNRDQPEWEGILQSHARSAYNADRSLLSGYALRVLQIKVS